MTDLSADFIKESRESILGANEEDFKEWYLQQRRYFNKENVDWDIETFLSWDVYLDDLKFSMQAAKEKDRR